MEEIKHPVTEADLESAVDRVGELHGWDFSRVRAVRDDAPWEYQAIVAESANAANDVLDIGTGGGETLRTLCASSTWQQVIAIDHSLQMASVASRSLQGRAAVVAGDAGALPFDKSTFDLVLDRHASVNPSEVARVLRTGGVFITQQVGPRNTQSIFDAFGWGSNWDQFAHDDPPPRRCQDLAHQFEQLGCQVDRIDEYEVGYAFEDLDSLVFFMRAAPFPEEFTPARHMVAFNRFLEDNLSERGIETTEHRELLVVRAR